MKKTNRRSKPSSPVHASASDPNQKQVYEERIRELERANKAYQMEIAELRQQEGGGSSGSKNGVEKLKKEYLQKLNLLEDQVTELKTKLESYFYKGKTDELKKEGTRKDIKTQGLLASNERLKMVLQRKTEEASAATKHLKDIITARKAISHRSSGARSRNALLIQDAEQELEVTTQLHKLCSQYESKMDKMAEEIAQLREEIEMQRQEKLGSQLQDEVCDSPENDSEIRDLKVQMNSLGCLLRELQSRKETLDFKDMKQEGLGLSLLSEESNDKIKMDTPEMSNASENSGLCCSCSKKSLCKTNKCKCRATGGSCGASCGCTGSKCTNRELNQLTGNEPLKSADTECTVEGSAVEKDGSVIASECAKLLQSALVEKPASCKDNLVPKKKPLCDIQNSLGKLDDQKQGKKKKARKPVIQVVTKDSVSLSAENSNITETNKIETRENNPTVLDTVTKPASESNSGQSNELATSISDAPGFRRLRNPTRQAKSVVGKENCLF
ncbi:hypothetical protein Fmac_007934 [Flemingia macrophylla]|uniref:Tesmin/TSO1-like CXC domain-containing protein n=1 Tax=Flemingia macrophylla TaxID=520843 RepID=A0ABD1MVZ9_9FABA